MAHFAKLDENNIVVDVIVVSNEDIQNLEFPNSESVGIAFCKTLFGEDTKWVQTSYNSSFRKNYAQINGRYDSLLDAFIPVKNNDFPSWILNETTCKWEAPVAYPTDGEDYIWNESTQTWILRP